MFWQDCNGPLFGRRRLEDAPRFVVLPLVAGQPSEQRRRRDEIGALFDGFNRLAAEIEPRLHDKAAEEPALDATCIQIPPKKRAA